MSFPVKCANCNGLHVCTRGAVCDSRCSTDVIPVFERNPLSPCRTCKERETCDGTCKDGQIWLDCMVVLWRERKSMIYALELFSSGELAGGDVE